MSETGMVRLAREGDVPAVLGLLETMHEESGVFNFDKPLVHDIVSRLTRDRSAGVIGVVDGPEQVVATVGLSLSQGAWYTRERTLCELWSFVHPEHRRSTHAKNLIAFSKECAERTTEAGCPITYFSTVKVGASTERKLKLYERQSSPIGTLALYLYTPKAAHA